MVQTYQSPVRVYKHPFELVMAAYEKRFPTCPQIPIFVGSEVTYEYHSEDGAQWVIERKCQLNVDAPYLVKKVHPDNPEWTCFEQNAALDVKSFFGFETAVEKLAMKQYAANLAKGKEILEYFIDELIKSGVTYIPQFEHKDSGSSADSAIDISKEHSSDETWRRAFTEERREFFIIALRFVTYWLPMLARRYDKTGKRRRSVKFVIAESKLEAEYIRRFLGQLSPLEESRLCELKYGLHAHHKGKLPNDAHLLRFLRARDFDVAKAKELVHNSIIWRKQHNVDRILQEWTPPSVMTQFFPGCWHHNDKEGRPLYLLRLGNLDMKGMLRSCGLENIVKLTLSICEEGLIKTAEATRQIGAPISTWSLLVDLEGLSMRHLWRPGVQSLLRIIEIVEAHYPETMGQVLVVRAPRVFPILWTLISPFIDETTRNKFMINSGELVKGEISKYVDDQYIPDFLGGTCLVSCPSGGHIPKSQYRPVQELPDDADVLRSMYTTASVTRGYPVEVIIPVTSMGCVLTWDFDILKSECEFIVYHTPKIIQEAMTPHSPSMLKPVEMVTAAIANNPLPVVISDPSLTLGLDLTIEEKPVVFQEGDSMQGSHFCSRSGTYILQWRIPEISGQHNTTFDFSIGTHKCRLMYYHELLNSADFRKGGSNFLNISKSCRCCLQYKKVSKEAKSHWLVFCQFIHNFDSLLSRWEMFNISQTVGSVASLESCRSSFSSIAPPSQPGTPCVGSKIAK
ncbi:CRAL/TRIO domain protein [Dictyocaulus viviparus]|uniref:CRAL/TRIO domain protein n=1 Tax=Dictyocaulus viviparus TaxID=29172 RepID=A0A0D8XEM5_DICVI|nr:CRAL/TRIO domain protein [Dictyocaulus viviparus]